MGGWRSGSERICIRFLLFRVFVFASEKLEIRLGITRSSRRLSCVGRRVDNAVSSRLSRVGDTKEPLRNEERGVSVWHWTMYWVDRVWSGVDVISGCRSNGSESRELYIRSRAVVAPPSFFQFSG